MIEEKINDISELAVIEYYYKNVGAIKGEKLKLFDCISVGQKSAIVTMEGVLKAGIDFSSVTLKVDDDKKIITVILPNSEILSNELDEDSLCIYDEKDSIFNKITIEDTQSIRQEIKDTSIENAEKNNILQQANEKAEMYIKNIIEMTPNVKDNYTIEFKFI